MRSLVLNLINLYQVFFSFDRGILMFLAPGGSCKFEITCSEYTKQHVEKYGVAKGLTMGLKRIISCR